MQIDMAFRLPESLFVFLQGKKRSGLMTEQVKADAERRKLRPRGRNFYPVKESVVELWNTLASSRIDRHKTDLEGRQLAFWKTLFVQTGTEDRNQKDQEKREGKDKGPTERAAAKGARQPAKSSLRQKPRM